MPEITRRSVGRIAEVSMPLSARDVLEDAMHPTDAAALVGKLLRNGYAIVPIEATDDMVMEGAKPAFQRHLAQLVWDAMVEAGRLTVEP